MAGLPKIQQAQYGDSTSIQKLGAVRSTNNPAADVQSMKSMQGGRPSGDPFDPMKLAQQAMKGQQQQAGQEDMRYSEMFGSLGQLYRDTMKLIRAAQRPDAGPVTKAYAKQAIIAYGREWMRVRNETPFFNDV